LVAERSGESFVGAITEIQSDSQDVSTTVRKHACCLAQSPAAHVAHRRLAGRPGEHMSEVVARFPATTDNSPSDTPPLNRLSSNHSAFRTLSISAPNEARERRTKVHRHPLDRNCVAGKGWDGIRPKAVATVTGDWVLTPALLRARVAHAIACGMMIPHRWWHKPSVTLNPCLNAESTRTTASSSTNLLASAYRA